MRNFFGRTVGKTRLLETAEERLNNSSRGIEELVRQASLVISEFQDVHDRVKDFASEGEEHGPKEQAT